MHRVLQPVGGHDGGSGEIGRINQAGHGESWRRRPRQSPASRQATFEQSRAIPGLYLTTSCNMFQGLPPRTSEAHRSPPAGPHAAGLERIAKMFPCGSTVCVIVATEPDPRLFLRPGPGWRQKPLCKKKG